MCPSPPPIQCITDGPFTTSFAQPNTLLIPTCICSRPQPFFLYDYNHSYDPSLKHNNGAQPVPHRQQML